MWITYLYREKFYEAKLQQQQRELKQLQEERRKLIEIQEKIQVLQKACPDLQVGRIYFFAHHFFPMKIGKNLKLVILA